jgi:hypothetical protein
MEELSLGDKQRIDSCDNYKLVKRIMQSCEDYAEFEIGLAVYIKRKKDNNYIGTGYSNTEPKHKFIIMYKDGGFLFAKRIIASGNPGAQITCITIEFPSDVYELEVDSDYLDSMLLDTEYDATAGAKDLAKKKMQATKINNRHKIQFNTPIESYHFLNNMKQGDIVWGCETSFGNQITKYQVASVETYLLDPRQKAYRGWSGKMLNHPHETYLSEGFTQGILIELSVLESENKYTGSKKVYFYNITQNEKYKHSNTCIYRNKPTKPEEIV